jgi:hypothetical protein
MTQIAARLRVTIVHFSGKLSSGLPKVIRRFVTEAMYEIAARFSPFEKYTSRSFYSGEILSFIVVYDFV